jgi:signal transduction histidine kinase/CheY-like chemotaxis protein/HPt (histidine-containing phosphotransfer) domain-containing protein
MAAENIIDSLKARIAHLEDNRRYIQNALEMVLSLEDFYTEIGGGNCSLETLLPEAKRRIDAIFPFEVMAFYMVDEADLSFKPAYWHPKPLGDLIRQEVEQMIEDGYFAWAIRERRGVIIGSKNHSRQCLVHVIANHNQVKGMFGGVLPKDHKALSDTTMTLLSIILLHVANASESMAYTDLLKNQSRLLEEQVAERTSDLTRSKLELQAAMDHAQAASRAKGDFLAKMSHELRTPLNGIIGMTEVALSTSLNDNQRQIIEIIERESVSLLRQINDVLDFSKIESGKLELERIQFDIRDLMDDVGQGLAIQASEKGLELNVFVDPAVPPVVEGDPVRLRQILINLTGNAVKFTHEGQVFIEAAPAASCQGRTTIRFTVTDTGIGIAPEKIDQVFSSFTQADDSISRQYGGTGLGTTISKQLVELMGGRIGIDSQAGKGSTFWFTADFGLGGGEPSPASPPHAEGGRKTIIVVDDNPTFTRIVTAYLLLLGLAVETAGDDRSALEMVRDKIHNDLPIDAVITKDRAPSIDGIGLKNRIRQLQAANGLPVIMSTNLKQMVQGDDAVALGFDGVLSKPVNIKRLKDTLDRVFAPRDNPASAMRSSRREAEPVASPTCSGRILVADDYVTNQQVAFMHLTAAGIQVDLADNGQQAVDACRENDYDLILMDIQMPILNGFDATQAIRVLETAAGKPRTPVIALTANAMKGDEQRCLEAGMDGYLTKPVRRAQLLDTVDRWIGRPNAGDNDRPSPAEPSATPAPISDRVMDTETAVDEFGDAETVKLVAKQLIDNVEEQLRTIRESIVRQDRERIRREAHAIKGGAATMEAVALSRAAAHLEQLSPDGSEKSLNAGCSAIEDQFSRFRDFISQWKEK